MHTNCREKQRKIAKNVGFIPAGRKEWVPCVRSSWWSATALPSSSMRAPPIPWLRGPPGRCRRGMPGNAPMARGGPGGGGYRFARRQRHCPVPGAENPLPLPHPPGQQPRREPLCGGGAPGRRGTTTWSRPATPRSWPPGWRPGSGRRKTEAAIICYGGLKLDTLSGCGYLEGHDLLLTQKEFALLLLLARKAEAVVSKQEVQREVWSGGTMADSRALWTLISRLRRKLKGENAHLEISSKRGAGYALEQI